MSLTSHLLPFKIYSPDEPQKRKMSNRGSRPVNSYSHPSEFMISGEMINQQASYGTVNFYTNMQINKPNVS